MARVTRDSDIGHVDSAIGELLGAIGHIARGATVNNCRD